MATSNTKNQSTAKKTIKRASTVNKTATKKASPQAPSKSKTAAKRVTVNRAKRTATTAGAKKTTRSGSVTTSLAGSGSSKNVEARSSFALPHKRSRLGDFSHKGEEKTNKNASTKTARRKNDASQNTGTKKVDGKNVGARFRIKNHPVTACVVTGIVCIFAGLLVGFYLLGSGFAMTGKTSIPESELDQPVGLYIINGVPNFITAREVLDSGNGLSKSLLEDGTYTYPTAEEVLAAVRTAVLNGEVTARGITISADDMKEYAQKQLGTSDYSFIANRYGLDEASVQTFVRQAVGINKLRQEITGVADQVAPIAPEEGLDAASYKQYILDLLGSNWDTQNNTWANEDNSYYTALGESAFNPDLATFEQASTAYSIASEKYQEDSAQAANTWNDFVNDALKNCQVRIGEAIL